MRKANERTLDSVIYARIREARISGADRQIAVDAYRNAEQLVDLFVWMKAKIAAFGNSFLKPSLKH
jgi:hypothetical protein